MATEAEHRKQAEHNRTFLNAIDKKAFPDWWVTVAFYSAVHLIEAFLARQTPRPHSGSHTRRNNILKRQYDALWREYRPLYAFSRLARYRCYSVQPEHLTYVERRLGRLEDALRKMV